HSYLHSFPTRRSSDLIFVQPGPGRTSPARRSKGATPTTCLSLPIPMYRPYRQLRSAPETRHTERRSWKSASDTNSRSGTTPKVALSAKNAAGFLHTNRKGRTKADSSRQSAVQIHRWEDRLKFHESDELPFHFPVLLRASGGSALRRYTAHN